MKPSFILSGHGLWDGAIAGAEIPKEYSIDIDTQFDYDVAKMMYEQLMQSVDSIGFMNFSDLAGKNF